MKKLIKNSAMLLTGLMAFACTDLEVGETDSQFIEKTAGGVTGQPDQLLETNYNDLGALTDQAGVYSLFTHTTDEMIPPTRGVDWGDNGVWRTLHAHTWDAAHSFVLSSWNILNERVYRCTLTLEANGINAQQTAEAKLLRSFYMHQILDLWGKVPFREVDEGVDVDPRVLSRQEAFDFIMDDLESAVAALPSIGPGPEQHQASKAAAYFLLAKMHLNKGVYTGTGTFDNADMTAVVNYVNDIEDEGYSLDPDYFSIFHPDNSDNEVILHSPSGNPANRMYMTTHYSQNPSGWNGFTTLADFYNTVAEDVDDQRLGKGPGTTGYVFDAGDFDGSNAIGIGYGFLIGQQYNDNGTQTIDSRSQQPLQFSTDVPLAGASTEKGIRVMKYHPSSSGFDTRNYILMRYADAHLMRAEALFRSGNTAGALFEINELRAIRGADVLLALTEQDIIDERGRELYWEGGRRTDQVRFGTFVNTWSEKTVQDENRNVFPIPAQALASNPNLTQNDGY